MKKAPITFLIGIGVLLIYVLLINFIATGLLNGLLDFDNNSENMSGAMLAMLDMSVQDTVDVTVVRNRWYGKIVENISQDDSKNVSSLYLFKFIKIPIVVGKFNLTLIHSVVLMLFFLSVVIASLFDLAHKIERRYNKNEMVL